ncbi:diacylglycerol/lipid kinase family protein [Ignavigranum ruoffiae]|uniref:Lipid kinase, YegS/Rv2252/BmrU family n=1 Tax=Ignavigranum ruoffiae TaxID=89093 RepID=A0A1H8ZZR0_9LACT|nr:diacylglycerol kinase family protein [Ignavigranum ruoffiae]SEP69835.1 lipid kinase, YegS/Rv2252/BmrU family [Ignavigranum ruoffiae]
MLKKVLLIVNPGSGKGQAVKYGEDLRKVLVQSHQSEVELRQTEDMDDPFDWAQQAADQGYDTVICLGGDGTVNKTVAGILASPNQRPYFSFVPMGTVNDLARALHMPLNTDQFIREFAKVETQQIDIGKINQSYFVNTIAIGTIAESVGDTSSDQKNKIGRLAYIRDGLAAAIEGQTYRLKIKDSSDRIHEIETPILVIGLTNSVGGFEQMNTEAEVNDGLMYLTALKDSNLLEMGVAVLGNKLLDLPTDKLLILKDHEFLIESMEGAPVASNVDGDAGPNLPLNLSVEANALNVYVPRAKD